MMLVRARIYLQSRFRRDEAGASLVEYVLLVALIAMVCFVAMQLLGTTTSDHLTNVANDVSAAS
jgi:Flp pilus assembly pilin Flp